MKHTPGPWVVEGLLPNMKVVFAGLVPGARHSPAVLIDGEPHVRLMDGDQEANARLIAAAPDMLEALKTLDALMAFDTEFGRCDCWDDVGGLNAAAKLARAAIAKATGEPQS